MAVTSARGDGTPAASGMVPAVGSGIGTGVGTGVTGTSWSSPGGRSPIFDDLADPRDRPDADRAEAGQRGARWWAGTVVATTVVVLVAGVGGFTLAGGGGEAGCPAGGPEVIALRVEVAPEIETVVGEAAGRLNDAEHVVGGKCVRADVVATDPAQVTTLLGQGLALGSESVPDVWIPDSSLWTLLVQSLAPGREVLEVTGTSVARSPLVVGMPKDLAGELRGQAARADPSWEEVLRASGGIPGESPGGTANDDFVPAGTVELRLPNPAANAAGLAALVIFDRMWAADPDGSTKFTGLVQALRANTVAGAAAGFRGFDEDGGGRYPAAVVPEQTVFAYNRSGPRQPALAVYPREGTLEMDYPFTLATADAEKVTAARLFEDVVRGGPTGAQARAAGFRSGDGAAPTEFGMPGGASPHLLPTPLPADVREAARAWYKLSLGIRNLTLVSLSGPMGEELSPGLTRLDATAQVLRGGVGALPGDIEVGLWSFASQTADGRAWRELVPVGPLGGPLAAGGRQPSAARDDVGRSAVGPPGGADDGPPDGADDGADGPGGRREQLTAAVSGLRAEPGAGNGLFDSVLAAVRAVRATYRPDMVNSVLVFTSGRDADPSGISFRNVLATLREESDRSRPVEVIVIGFGDVDLGALRQIAETTGGSAHLVQNPQQIQDVILTVMSQRVCTAPVC